MHRRRYTCRTWFSCKDVRWTVMTICVEATRSKKADCYNKALGADSAVKERLLISTGCYSNVSAVLWWTGLIATVSGKFIQRHGLWELLGVYSTRSTGRFTGWCQMVENVSGSKLDDTSSTWKSPKPNGSFFMLWGGRHPSRTHEVGHVAIHVVEGRNRVVASIQRYDRRPCFHKFAIATAMHSKQPSYLLRLTLLWTSARTPLSDMGMLLQELYKVEHTSNGSNLSCSFHSWLLLLATNSD